MKSVVKLYKESLKNIKLIDNDNFRDFARRRVREDYRNVEKKASEAVEGLEVIKRYIVMSKLYWSEYYKK